MKIFFIIIIALASLSFSNLTYQDGIIIDNNNNQKVSHEELINMLDNDENLKDNKNFIKFKKSYNRLNSKGSKYIYFLSVGSIITGIDGELNPEDFLDEESPPGVDNILFGILLSSSYYGYNKINKERSLYRLIQDYNYIYFEKEKESNLPYPIIDKVFDVESWNGSMSFGLLNEKIPFSFIEFSWIFNRNQYSEFYGTFTSAIFGGGLGLGHKYYYKNKSEASMFISSSIHVSILGDELDTVYGLTISPGYYIPTYNLIGEHEKSFIKAGLSFTYMGDGSSGVTPFINIEKKLR